MEKISMKATLENILEQSGTTEPVGTDRTEEILTPPARENTGIDIDYIDELDEIFGLSLDDEADLIKNLNINDIPLDGKSPDVSSESEMHQSDYEGLCTDRSEYIAELEKVASQSDVDDHGSDTEKTEGTDEHDVNDTDTVEENTDSRAEARGMDMISRDAGLGLTTKTCSELQMSTWHSTLVSDCDSASRTTCSISDEKMTSEAEAKLNERMSSGKKSAVKFYEDEDDAIDDESDDAEISRNASRLALESREAMFRRAMTLLSARCTSMKQGLDPEGLGLPFGIQMPKYIYVTQEKPLPMEPLKAWRGYNGNVYFEPIQVNPLKNPLTQDSIDQSPKDTVRLQLKQTPRKSDSDKVTVKQAGTESRSDSRQTVKSSGSVGNPNRPTTRQMAILDKQAVINRFNESLHEDIIWLEGQENTGSLAIRPRTEPHRDRKKDLLYNKERICKGSVAHKLYVEKNASAKRPRFAVSGGKFTPPNSMSPLLRTQTQYSLSSHRLTTNSPDMYHLNDNKLPALDQLKASLKHSGGIREKSYSRPLTVTTEMKPFVKYSPDAVAKFAQQAM